MLCVSRKNMKNTAGAPSGGGAKPPRASDSNTKKKGETEISPEIVTFVLYMSKQLSEAQRYEIYLGLKRKWSKSRIAREIGVSPSTVCREVCATATAPAGMSGATRSASAMVGAMAFPATPQAVGALVEGGGDDCGRRLIAGADRGRAQDGGCAYMQADHLQPRARRHERQAKATPATRAQVYTQETSLQADKSH